MSLKFERVVLAVVLSLPVIAGAQAPIENQLRQKYVGSERMLRHFFAADTLRFDSSGNPLNQEKTGSWTLLGGVVIDRLALSSKELELQGHRMIVKIDDATRTMKQLKWNEKVTIHIPVATGSGSLPEQLFSALDKVFVSPGGDLVGALPDYWQDYMARFFDKQIQGEPCQGSAKAGAEADSGNPSQGPSPMRSAGVVEGRLIHRVEPLYLPVARQARVQGEIGLRALITKSGDVAKLCITQAIGGGMDDEVVNTTQQWKYSPYLLNEQPVEIETSIAFKFRMR